MRKTRNKAQAPEQLISQLLSMTDEERAKFVRGANASDLPSQKSIVTFRILGGKFIVTMMNYTPGFIELLKREVRALHRQYNPSTKEWVIDKNYLTRIKLLAEHYFTEVRVLEEKGPSRYDTAYGVLELSQDCSDGEIKKAYRKLVVRHHPDKGGENEYFLRIQNAYEILSDAKRRKRYDAAMKLTSKNSR